VVKTFEVRFFFTNNDNFFRFASGKLSPKRQLFLNQQKAVSSFSENAFQVFLGTTDIAISTTIKFV